MIFTAVLAVSLLAAPAAAPDRRAPIDTCASDASFVAFRDNLRGAIARRDRAALLAVVTDATIVDYGGGVGRADFVSAWRLDDPANSPVWRELEDALGLGCARDEDGSFWAPSIAIQLADQDDLFSAMIARPGAVLRAEADAASAAVAGLEWDVLTLQSDDGSDDWLPVTLVDGRSGFVRREQVRALLDYRAVFERIDGRWVMSAFVAGD
ncbi:MAG: hypothetical protein ACXWUX_11050 [Allosphingosinicella sp.]